MRSPSLPGIALLAEVGMSFVETICPTISPDNYNDISKFITNYLNDTITFEACRSHVFSKIHQDMPVTRLRDILSVPDEPLPYHGDPNSDEGPLTLRRRTRPWTSAEDHRLLAGVLRYGMDNWQQIAAFVGSGRNRAQCSQRWARGLNPRISKRSWTPEEDQRLRELVTQYGEKAWARIAATLGNRSDVQCRYHYRQAELGKTGNMPLMRKSNLTTSTSVFSQVRAVETPEPSKEESPIELAQSRPFLSSAMVLPQPLITDRMTQRFRQSAAIEFQPQHRQGGVVGCDPDSLNSFLRSFQ
jgi:hypothetical protein